MADFTTIANMVTIPEHFSQYVVDRTTELNTFINSGIASPDARVAQLLNGSPEGGRFIYLPSFNPLDGEDQVFGEDDVELGGIDTKEAKATLIMRQHAWGSTDLAHVLSGADPMAAIAQLIADWRNTREQAIYLSILKGLFAENGALKAHVNDISAGSGDAANISNGATLDTKQLLGDHYASLGMVFMHSAVYTYLQKNGMITRTPIFDPATSPIEMEEYLGYRIKVDDAMPVTEGVYDTYFLGKNSFVRQDGTPSGFIATETDRDKIGAKNVLIHRWCQIIHPRGLSWKSEGTYENPAHKYPANVDLAKPENWELNADHKKVALACLRHKIG